MRHNALAVLAIATACNLPRPARVVDDGGPDATPDGPDASPRGTVHVTAMDLGGSVPAGGIPVVFFDPSGQLVTMTNASSKGQAQADLLPGGSVTAVYMLSSTQYDMETILGVKPGDDLLIAPTTDHTQLGTFTLTYPTYAGATQYTAATSCGPCVASSSTAICTLYKDCIETPMSASVAAYTSAGLRSYMEKNDITFVDGGSATFIGSWPALMSFSTTSSNISPRFTHAQINRWVPNLQAFHTLLFDGAPASNMVMTSSFEPKSASAVIEAEFTYDTGAVDVTDQFTSGNTNTYSLDVAASVLPVLATPTIDVTNRTVSPFAGAATADILETRVVYTRGGNETFVWQVMSTDVDEFDLPVLPQPLDVLDPKPGDIAIYGTGAAGTTSYLVDLDGVDGYDEARNNAFNLVNTAGLHSIPQGNTMVRWSRSP